MLGIQSRGCKELSKASTFKRFRERWGKVLAVAPASKGYVAMIDNWNHSRPSLSSDLSSLSSTVDTHPARNATWSGGGGEKCDSSRVNALVNRGGTSGKKKENDLINKTLPRVRDYTIV